MKPLMAQNMQGMGAPQPADMARTKYVPSLATTRYIYGEQKEPGDEASIEKLWSDPVSVNPAVRMQIPADHQMDLQTFFFGPMTHSLTVRPRRPETGCCAACKPFQFDVANDMFSPAFATGEISNSMCACSHDVTVNMPTGQQKATIGEACCTCQPRLNFTWESGEVMSYRYPPGITMCGPWRTGYVGTAPGEEENYLVRYWDIDGMFIDCSLKAICLGCCLPCSKFCFELKHCCDCNDRFHYTSWYMWSLTEIRERLLNEYSFVLRSAFGEPQYEMVGDDVYVEFKSPTYHSDVNALGNWRASLHKAGCCCKFLMTDSTDVTDLSLATGFDLTFRGTLNQNQLDPKDFNLALGYLILLSYQFLKMRQQSQSMPINVGLPRSYRWFRALVAPRQAGQYSAPASQDIL